MSDPKPYRKLGSRYLWRSQWYNLRQDDIQLPDGSRSTYTVVEHPGAVWIVPLTADGKLAMIRNYRYTVNDWCLELPAGGLREGVSPQEMARRELLEETGGEAETIQQVATFYVANGISDEVAHVFLATGVTLGQPQREASEVMSLRLMDPNEALRMARQGEIVDGPSALALLLCADALSA